LNIDARHAQAVFAERLADPELRGNFFGRLARQRR
jgi:hypothetical protein